MPLTAPVIWVEIEAVDCPVRGLPVRALPAVVATCQDLHCGEFPPKSPQAIWQPIPMNPVGQANVVVEGLPMLPLVASDCPLPCCWTFEFIGVMQGFASVDI